MEYLKKMAVRQVDYHPKLFPQRELHGRALNRFYAEQDAKKAMLKKMGEALMAKAREAQR